MPQETNLNVAPYFDDFDTQSNYYKVLFKPAYPVQARELNNLQSIVQDQVENLGNHFFKEGAKVIPGQTTYLSSFTAVEIEPKFTGISVSAYLDQLIDKKITGRKSGVTAKVVKYITDEESARGNYTLYVDYIESSTNADSSKEFFDNEVLTVGETISFSNTFISSGEGVAQTIASNSTSTGSAFGLSSGVYFLRGYFVDVFDQIMILDQYTNTPSYRIGLYVKEELISSESDRGLNDNAQGFSNFTAPGADRLKISADLAKRDLDDYDDENFVQIALVVNGILRELDKGGKFNQDLRDELARRTFDESGHYYIREFVTTVKESLNNGIGNRGIYNEGQLTDSGSKPSNDLALYKIAPGKAYVRGYEIEKNYASFLDCPKPRTTKTVENQAINFGFGPTWRVNRSTGSPLVGFNTTTTVSLRSRRVGVNSVTAPGNEIGVARAYDYALESGAYDLPNPNINQWDLSLFDVQTYTDISINEPHTIQVPSFVEGQSSGATGFLRHQVEVGTGITVYGGKGNFVIGERITFNGIGTDARTAIGITQYSLTDIESVYSNTTLNSSGINTFTADIIPSEARVIGIASISAAPTISWIKTNGNISGGVTVTSPGFTWPGIVTTGDLVSFSVGGQSDKHFARVETVNTNSIGISSVANVAGICTGDLPHGNGGTTNVTPTEVTNFTLLESKLEDQLGSGNAANNQSLYSIFPRKNIENINFVDNTLDIRRQFNDLEIDANGNSSTITAGTNEVFLSYDEERYTMVRSDGAVIPLSSGNLEFGSGNTTLTFKGLEVGFNNIAKVAATLRKSKITSKQKVRNIGANTLIEYSTNSASGTDASGSRATLNDGLTFGNYPYGTRVQDESISLNVPDVVVVYGIFESLDTSDPIPPSMTVGSMDGPTATATDLILGEEVIGDISGARALYMNRVSDTSIQFVYENENVFTNGELIKFQESGITAITSNNSIGSKNITEDFNLSNGQKNTIYDYARIMRKANAPVPSKKIKVWYLSASYNSSDTGDITTINSYSDFKYGSEISSVDGIKCSDIIDARPRVSDFTVSAGGRSPFEFEGRSFDGGQHSSKDVIASDESLILDYSYYLPRIDRIFLDTDGVFTVKYGVPADNPVPPEGIPGAINIANAFLPAYLFDTSSVKIKFIDYKRYQMSDINRLEQRVRSVEYYTSLSKLENSLINQFVPDANGLDRFKSGFFTDNFGDLSGQDLTVGVRNSIDRLRGELRPSHYTTAMQLQIGSDAVAGIGTTAVSADERFANILGANIRKNIKQDGDPCSVICLDYSEVDWLTQPFATRSESVTPFLVRFWQGTLALNPTADVWINTTLQEPRDVTIMGSLDGLAGAMRVELQGEPGNRSGVSPIIWGAWETTGVDVDFSLDVNNSTSSNTSSRQGGSNDLHLIAGSDWRSQSTGWFADGFPSTFQIAEETTSLTTTVSGEVGVDLQQRREGVQNTVVERIDSELLGERMIRREIIQFMRSRNIEFTGRALKPYTRIYSFFDNVDVTEFCTPKLLEISMTSGTFQVGEEVIGTMGSVSTMVQNANSSNVPNINFRVAQSNHKYGPFDDPTDTFVANPYNRGNIIPAAYSESATLLNIDTNSLAAEENVDQGGYIGQNMTLIGQTSGAQATITDIRLMTDGMGTLIGSFRVPETGNAANPAFETGRNRLRLTSSAINSKVSGLFTTSAEETFYSEGSNDISEDVNLRLRNAEVTVDTAETNPNLVQNRTIGDSASASASSTVDIGTQATGEYRDPLAQSFTVDDSEGIFVSSVDIFFQSVDFNGPVEVELREVELGIPVTKRIPGTLVILEPNNIQTSLDATVATNVTFDYPVYLHGKKEYALVILSNVTEYRVWISRLGEVDVTTLDAGEAGQTLVSTQTTLGSLFKSQTGSTWTPSQYEDLKFTLKRANFVPNGTVQFFNPPLNTDMQRMKRNPLTAYANDLKVGVNTVLSDNSLIAGSKVTQQNTTASGIFVGYGGSATGDLTLTNPGIGYTPLAGNCFYPAVSLKTLSGSGINATADITVINGVAIAATVTTTGGKGYSLGDTLTITSIGGTTTGSGMEFTVANIAGPNELRLEGVQGEFTTNTADYLKHQNSSGVTTIMNYAAGTTGAVIPVSPFRSSHDGLHMKVWHRNHGMHSSGNVVTLKNLSSDVTPTTLSAAIVSTSTASIGVGATTDFAAFENVAVGATNPGYAKIGQEIIKYTGVSGATLTGITRAQEGTIAADHSADDQVYKYEMDGVSLRRINTNHNLNEVTVSNPITLDSYYVKIDMTSNGENRTGAAGSLPSLKFNSTKSSGGVDGEATYNVPFEEVIPSFNAITPTQTNITSAIRTVSGTSVDGVESSFVDKGFQDITLNRPNYFDSPRIVASTINETTYLGSLPGKKSLTVNMDLSTGNPKLTPMVDLDQASVKFISNRVNSPVTNFATDWQVKSVVDDPCRFFYVTKLINLENPSTSVRVILDAYVDDTSDLRVFYALNQQSMLDETVFTPFPGYNNLAQDRPGIIENLAKSDGRSDKAIPTTDSYQPVPLDSMFREMQWSVDRMPTFNSLRIKIIGTSTNQAFVPRVKNLRVMALA